MSHVMKPHKQVECDGDTECPICFETKSSRFSSLSCDHRFHHTCIQNWRSSCLKNRIVPTCPMCRQLIG